MASPITQGVRDFVSALGSRGQIRQKAKANAWGQADDRLKAELLADELLSKRGLGDAYQNLGIERGGDLATVSRAGYANFPQATQGLKDLADLALQRQAVGVATGENPDVAMLNRILASRTQGGGPLSPQEASVVPLGEALVNRQQSQSRADLSRAGASDAQALAQQALAALRGRTDPNLRSVGPKNRLLSGSAPTVAPPRAGTLADDLEQIEQDLGTVLTPEQRATYLNTGKLDVPNPVSHAGPFRPGAILSSSDSTEAIDGRLPIEAVRRLKEGVETTFKNQQVWTLSNGTPSRIK